MNKRSLFLSALGGIASLLGADLTFGATTPTVEITVRADSPGAVINPAIYGQFAEHLGGLHTMGEASAPTLTVSAARGVDGRLHIALVNLNPREALHGAIRIPGATVKKFTGTILTASAMDAHNTFDTRETVKPAAFKGARVQQGLVHVGVPAESIIVLSEAGR